MEGGLGIVEDSAGDGCLGSCWRALEVYWMAATGRGRWGVIG